MPGLRVIAFFNHHIVNQAIKQIVIPFQDAQLDSITYDQTLFFVTKYFHLFPNFDGIIKIIINN